MNASTETLGLKVSVLSINSNRRSEIKRVAFEQILLRLPVSIHLQPPGQAAFPQQLQTPIFNGRLPLPL